MMRLLIAALVLAGGITLIIMAGTVLLPVILIVMAVWFLAALFTPAKRSRVPFPEADDAPPDEPGYEEDVPAGQAVIDVTAQVVEEKEAE